jgi:hypothetical protein
MQTVHLRGRVFPEETKCTLPTALPFTWPWPERGVNPQFLITIKDAAIDVECTVEDYREQDRVELHRRALDLCRAVVGLSAFRQAIGLSVILNKFTNPNGIEVTLTGQDRRLPPVCTAIHDSADLDRVFHLVLSEPILIRHLTDLVESISVPHESLC